MLVYVVLIMIPCHTRRSESLIFVKAKVKQQIHTLPWLNQGTG